MKIRWIENFQSNSLSTQAAANISSRTGSQESSARADFQGDHLYLYFYLYLYLYMSAWESEKNWYLADFVLEGVCDSIWIYSKKRQLFQFQIRNNFLNF